MKKNMKIEITPEQKIGEVVRELERLGYKKLDGLDIETRVSSRPAS